MYRIISMAQQWLFSMTCMYQAHVEPYVHWYAGWLEANWPRGLLGIGNVERVECYRKGVLCGTPGEADLVLRVPARGPFGPPSKVIRLPPASAPRGAVVSSGMYGIRISVKRAGVNTWSQAVRLVHPTRDFMSPGNVVLDRAFMEYLLRAFHMRRLHPEDTYTLSFLSGDNLTSPVQISDETGVMLGRKPDNTLRSGSP